MNSVVVNDQKWLEDGFIPTVAKRSAAIIEARGAPSARRPPSTTSTPESTGTAEVTGCPCGRVGRLLQRARTGGRLTHDPTSLDDFERRFDLIGSEALSASASRGHIARIMEAMQ